MRTRRGAEGGGGRVAHPPRQRERSVVPNVNGHEEADWLARPGWPAVVNHGNLFEPSQRRIDNGTFNNNILPSGGQTSASLGSNNRALQLLTDGEVRAGARVVVEIASDEKWDRCKGQECTRLRHEGHTTTSTLVGHIEIDESFPGRGTTVIKGGRSCG